MKPVSNPPPHLRHARQAWVDSTVRLVTHRRLGAQSTYPMAGKLFVARVRLWPLVR